MLECQVQHVEVLVFHRPWRGLLRMVSQAWCRLQQDALMHSSFSLGLLLQRMGHWRRQPDGAKPSHVPSIRLLGSSGTPLVFLQGLPRVAHAPRPHSAQSYSSGTRCQSLQS